MVNNGSSTSNRYTSAANLKTAAASAVPSLFQNDVVAALYRLFVLLLRSVLMWPNGSVNIFDCAHAHSHTGHGNKTNLMACISFYSRECNNNGALKCVHDIIYKNVHDRQI